jgi:mannose-6-phosphate isomerase-like protein (cupin superfamily)
MFERYTEHAKRAIFFARYEAGHYGSKSIGTEHLLLGILRENVHVIDRFTNNFASTLRDKITETLTFQEKIPPKIDLPLSDESKRILAYAAEEAERQNDRHLRVEHLLLGILREDKCVAAQFLAEYGLQLNTLRERLAQSDITIDGTVLNLAGQLTKIPGSEGKSFPELFNHGTLSVELYAPNTGDEQTPRTRDAAYIVSRGSGEFVFAEKRVRFSTGDFLFAAAGVIHRFENFTDDVVLWLIIYGPVGGESS